MFLKKIELNGFKSFANKTEFEINKGITAVVGPNGSGKSNIIDGIKWVLGEQSAKTLRGSKMEDVIFSGSDSRKQKNYAEVSLTFDNQDKKLDIDFREVSILRRIFRDGESEYFINKTPCRLKDIHELFMDTGVGREAYSIISQGQVEEILNSRPEEKRLIFEEAAGIVKYKNKKKESLKKLEETEQNLVRVDDILYQLEQSIPQLQVEAEKASHFKNIKGRLKGLEVAVVLDKINNLENQYIETEKQIEERKLLQTEVQRAYELVENENEELALAKNQLENEKNRLRDLEIQLMKELESVKYSIQLNNQQINEAKKRIEGIKFENSELENFIDEGKVESQKIETKLLELNEQMFNENKTLAEEDLKVKGILENIERDKIELDNLKDKVIDILNIVATSKNEIKNIEGNIRRIENDCERKKKEVGILGDRSTELSLKKSQLSQDLDVYKNNITKKEQLHNEIETKKKNISNDINKLTTQKVNKTNSLNELISKIKGLTNLEESLAGYNVGSKEVLKKYKDNPSLSGAVAQLIEVPNHLTLALEIALGSSLQHLVVKDENFASEAVDYLSKNRLGRATFLPLTIIKGSSMEIDDEGVLGVASKLVNYDKKYQGIIDFLLGKIIIVDNLQTGLKIAKKYGYKFRIVSLEGDVINAGGSITGGKYSGKSSGLLQRSAEIDQLKSQREVLIGELNVTNLNLKELDNKLNIQTAQETDIKSELEKLNKEKNELAQQLLLTEQELKNVTDHINLVAQELSFLEKDQLELISKLNDNKVISEQKSKEQQELSAKITRLNDKIITNNDQYETLKARSVSKKITLASLEQQINSLKKQLSMQQENKNRSLVKLENNNSVLNKLNEELIYLGKDTSILNKNQIDLEEKKIELSKKIDENSNGKRDLDHKIVSVTQKFKDLENSKEQIISKINNLNLKKSKIILELDGCTEKLLSDYFLTVTEAKKLDLPIVNDKDSIKEINILREDLKGLGEVNLGAIEEFSKVKSKIEFLQTQKSDLNKAKLDLRKVIMEMDKQMAVQFEQSFEKIKIYFSEVFQKLFNGGRGYLRLTEPDNILESGVEIFVQPPGKKLQSMTLLSGGEKALTAIALLFAILKTKPSPFCVLDEIEASLDEANVDRFGAFLQEMAQESQFIVVTHRKGTMECADILYGITMEEYGISKQISVNLDKKVG